MKIRVLRREFGRHGYPQYVMVAIVHYPVEHVWTDIERKVIDRLVVEQDGIELEWDCYVDHVRLNRVFVYWNNHTAYFYVNDPEYDMDQVLFLSQQILQELVSKLSPFKLMVSTNKIMTNHVRKIVRQIIVNVVKKNYSDQRQSRDQDQMCNKIV